MTQSMFETYNVQGMIVGYKGQPQGQAQSRLETYIMQGSRAATRATRER